MMSWNFDCGRTRGKLNELYDMPLSAISNGLLSTMSTLSLPAVLPSTSRNLNYVDQVRRTRSLSNVDNVSSLVMKGEGEGDSTVAAVPGPRRSQARFTPPAGRSSTRHVAIDVARGEAISSNKNAPSTEPRGTLFVEPPADQKKKEEERHLVNMLQQYTSVKSSGSRNYNYEDKYPADEPGEELGPNARFFNVYLDEAEKFDDDMVRSLSGTLDALLIFAALFSAVVTTFAVDTSHALEPDQALITSSLLYEQVQYLRANGNATIIATVQPSQYTPESPTHSSSDIWVNGLFLASLSLSLATALLSVLAKQWLQAYTSATSGSARDTALIRHLRFMGFEEWKVPQIIGFLPLILHASLGVFIAGLIVFLRALYPILSWIVVGIAGPAFSVYLVSIVLPAVYIRCPYRITVLYAPIKTVILLIELPFTRLRYWHRRMHYEHWWRRLYRRFLKAFRSFSRACSAGIHFISSKLFPSTLSASTIKGNELRLVQSERACRPILCDGIVWLHNMSSNISVRQVAALSVAGRDVDSFSKSQLKSIQRSKLHLTAVSAGKEPWDPDRMSSLSHRASNRLADLFRSYDIRPNDLMADWYKAAWDGRVNETAFLLDVWKVPVDSRTSYSATALYTAASQGHYATMKLLLNLGADPSLISAGCFGNNTALALLCQRPMGADGYEIAKLLLNAGADINLRGAGVRSVTPLYAASSFADNVEPVKWLIEIGADVDMLGGPEGAALHCASWWGTLETARVLLDFGATINLKNQKGKTALTIAIANGASRVEALLRERGATE